MNISAIDTPILTTLGDALTPVYVDARGCALGGVVTQDGTQAVSDVLRARAHVKHTVVVEVLRVHHVVAF